MPEETIKTCECIEGKPCECKKNNPLSNPTRWAIFIGGTLLMYYIFFSFVDKK